MSEELENAIYDLKKLVKGEWNSDEMPISYDEAKAILSELNRTCEWNPCPEETVAYKSTCGYFRDMHIHDKYCSKCGGKIEVIE